ncbi:PEPxxWA-CTERM sorting domain-containing protein [Parasphingorhabdus sp.]|uniref:PEPxxWA-CTERM sorting domain-containing protein n=1 Tax=Parasphingorhabdus sp. TaxID=2709688 RepID=UPI003267810C
MKKLLVASAALSFAFVATPASAAALLTSDAGYAGPSLNIGSFADMGFNFTDGPLALPGGITYSSTSTSSVIGNGSYGLQENGESTTNIIGTNSPTATVTLTFDDAVSSFGAFMNYSVQFSDGLPDGDNPVISAFDINDNLIGSYDLFALAPIVTPGGVDAFEFRGIDGEGVGIKSFTLAGGFLIARSEAAMGAIPEPATWAFMIFGFGAIGGAMRRQRKANVKVSYA